MMCVCGVWVGCVGVDVVYVGVGLCGVCVVLGCVGYVGGVCGVCVGSCVCVCVCVKSRGTITL